MSRAKWWRFKRMHTQQLRAQGLLPQPFARTHKKKVRHLTVEVAQRHAESLQRWRRRPYDVYICYYCGFFHVGSHVNPPLIPHHDPYLLWYLRNRLIRLLRRQIIRGIPGSMAQGQRVPTRSLPQCHLTGGSGPPRRERGLSLGLHVWGIFEHSGIPPPQDPDHHGFHFLP